MSISVNRSPCDPIDPPAKNEVIIRAINDTRFWVIRAGVCIKLGDYESALNRIERALEMVHWITIASVYGI